jgi:prepilin-type N-terminal cleavage/methylation domain-containing protein
MKQSGFTLLEILVAMTILSVGIVGTMHAFSLSMRAGTEASRLARASEIARRELVLAAAAPSGGIDNDGAEDAYTWRIREMDQADGLLVVSVTVNWLDRGRPQSFALSQVVFSRAPQDTE